MNQTDYVNDRYRLCFVRDREAWFAPCDPKRVNGSDWDREYISEAGHPESYIDARGKSSSDFRVVMYGLGETDMLSYASSSFSVDYINANAVGWIRSYLTTQDDLPAGASMSDFITFIELHGGKVFTPVNGTDIRSAAFTPKSLPMVS